MAYRHYYAKPKISGSGLICYGTSQSFSVQNFVGVTYSWSASSNLNIGSDKTSSSINVNSLSSTTSAAGWVEVEITVTAYNKTRTIRKNLWLGKPGVPITNPYGYPTVQLSLNDILLIRVSSAPGASSNYNYNWTITGSIDEMSTTLNSCTVVAESTGTGNFYVTSGNGCGRSPSGGGSVFVSSGGGGASKK